MTCSSVTTANTTSAGCAWGTGELTAASITSVPAIRWTRAGVRLILLVLVVIVLAIIVLALIFLALIVLVVLFHRLLVLLDFIPIP